MSEIRGFVSVPGMPEMQSEVQAAWQEIPLFATPLAKIGFSLGLPMLIISLLGLAYFVFVSLFGIDLFANFNEWSLLYIALGLVLHELVHLTTASTGSGRIHFFHPATLSSVRLSPQAWSRKRLLLHLLAPALWLPVFVLVACVLPASAGSMFLLSFGNVILLGIDLVVAARIAILLKADQQIQFLAQSQRFVLWVA